MKSIKKYLDLIRWFHVAGNPWVSCTFKGLSTYIAARLKVMTFRLSLPKYRTYFALMTF